SCGIDRGDLHDSVSSPDFSLTAINRCLRIRSVIGSASRAEILTLGSWRLLDPPHGHFERTSENVAMLSFLWRRFLQRLRSEPAGGLRKSSFKHHRLWIEE